MTVKKLAVGLSLLAITLCVNAEDMQSSRYITISNAPVTSDDYSISTVVQENFPPTVMTVGDAISEILSQTSYRLLQPSKNDPLGRDLYSQPLPGYLRSVGPESLQNALLQLSGNVYQVVIDPVHRLVTFRLRQKFQTL